MAHLRRTGLYELIRGLRNPVLGICLGQQLMCAHSEEGDTECLGIFDVPVVKFKHEGKIPHMGWNSLSNLKGPLFRGLEEESFVYFVHSYYVPICPMTIAECDYFGAFSAATSKDNFYATQFHPEKSGDPGHQILKNFVKL
jgi:imidazole glycerol-phosphate synthase subunit HisH